MTEQTASPAVSSEEWQTWRSFRQMRRRLDLALERQLQKHSGISEPDYSILIMLFESPERQLRANELGAFLGWEKSRVSHQVSRMEKRGLVERRECDTDARGTWVTMTPAGTRAVLGAMREHAASLRRYFFDALTPDELAVLQSASAKVLDALEPCEELDN
jgi:DNA-binding MarR family transcriptional regulator